MRYLKSFNESLQNRREFIRLSDLEDMCKFNTKYFSTEDKKICSKFLEDGIVTDDLLKIYCSTEIETWGDRFDIVEFVYGDKIIYGKYFNQDYPAKVSFDINQMNTPPVNPNL